MIAKGTPVHVYARSGSIGIVAGHHVGRHYVKFNYGKDVYGAPITATSGLMSDGELITIRMTEYRAYVAHKAWSGRQDRTHRKILKRLENIYPLLRAT